MTSSEAGYRTHRPWARARVRATADGDQAGSPSLVAEDPKQSGFVLSSPLSVRDVPGGWLHSSRNFSPLPSLLVRVSGLQLLGAGLSLLQLRCGGDTWRSGSRSTEDGELRALGCGLHQRLALQGAAAGPQAHSRVGDHVMRHVLLLQEGRQL